MNRHLPLSWMIFALMIAFTAACGGPPPGVDGGKEPGEPPTPADVAVSPPAAAAEDSGVDAASPPPAAVTAADSPTPLPAADREEPPPVTAADAALPAAAETPQSGSEAQPAASLPPAPPDPTHTSVPECGIQWFFPDAPPACPESQPLPSYAAAQRFEHGQMIWIEQTDSFYLLFDQGRHPADSRQHYQQLGPLALKPGASPDNRVGEQPPAGLLQPVSGFGLIWRGEVEGLDADIRAALGWAVEAEYGYDAVIQCRQPETYSSRLCYLRGGDGSVIALGWGAVTGSVWYRLD